MSEIRVVDRGFVARGADQPDWARRSIRRTNIASFGSLPQVSDTLPELRSGIETKRMS